MTEARPSRQSSQHPAFVWPTPHFFQRAEPPSAGPGGGCVVERTDGSSMHGELLALEPDSGVVILGVPGQAGPERIAIDQVRMIRLDSPFTLIRDVAVIDAIGAGEAQVADEVGFVVAFNDGSTLSGRTCGFVRKPIGLFLFLMQDASPHAIGCFIPAQQLKELQVGGLLGAALTANHAISGKTLAAALDKQARLREQRLGSYLSDHAIVSAAQLTQALQHQDQMSAVNLGDILIAENLITLAQLEDALGTQRVNRSRRLGDILVEMGAVTTRVLQKALSEKLGIPFVDVSEFVIDPATLRLLPGAVALKQQVLPLLRSGDTLVVAVENPLSADPVHGVAFGTSLRVTPVIADPVALRARIALEYTSTDDRLRGGLSTAHAVHGWQSAPVRERAAEDASQLVTRLEKEAPDADREDEEQAQVSDNALVRLVNKMIIDAHAQGASDIHIESNAGKAFTRIRFRKDGQLADYLELQSAYRKPLVSRIKIMAKLDIAEHRHAQDGKINFGKFGPLSIELRVAIVPTANDLEDVVLRLLGGVEPLPIDRLGLSARDAAELERMISRHQGLMLVCGPTGSGKTTTLHSVLHHINRPDQKIWTAEDPVEITQKGLRQVQINSRIGWTFAAAMRAFLRADPDVIMVGEMRDAETTKMGIEASLTGHLVLSTLHTNSAAETVVRLLDLGMDPFTFSDALIGVLSQRLARTLCKQCKTARAATDAELADLAREYCAGTAQDSIDVLRQWRGEYGVQGQLPLYTAAGCEKCTNGYRGRMGVYELLAANQRVKGLIGARGSVAQLVEAALEGGMKLLRQDAIDKVLRGALDLASARAAYT